MSNKTYHLQHSLVCNHVSHLHNYILSRPGNKAQCSYDTDMPNRSMLKLTPAQ